MTKDFEEKLEKCVHEHLEKARIGERKRIAYNLSAMRCDMAFIARAVDVPRDTVEQWLKEGPEDLGELIEYFGKWLAERKKE